MTMGGNIRCKMRGGTKDMKISRKEHIRDVPDYLRDKYCLKDSKCVQPNLAPCHKHLGKDHESHQDSSDTCHCCTLH